MRQTVRSLRERVAGAAGRALIRRLRVAASAGVRWVLEGHEDAAGNLETEEAEVAPGVGFYARPRAGDRAEAIVVKVGGESGHPMVVATRNHDGIKRLGQIAADETAVFNSIAHVTVKASGEIHIAAIGGIAAPLATLADLQALRTAIQNAVPVANDGGAALRTAILAASWTNGTTKLRGQ